MSRWLNDHTTQRTCTSDCIVYSPLVKCARGLASFALDIFVSMLYRNATVPELGIYTNVYVQLFTEKVFSDQEVKGFAVGGVLSARGRRS